MKLKKIVSLALAGILAVSMLAGCSGNSGDKNEGVVVNPTGTAASVIAELNKDTTDKVTFTADSALETALNTYVEYLGNTAFTDVKSAKNYFEGLANLNTKDLIANGSFNDNKNAQTFYVIETLGNYPGVSESVAVYNIATAIENSVKDMNSAKEYVDTANKAYYTYKFDGKVAVVEAENTMGQSTYVYAYSITRTPTKVSG